MSPRVLLGSFLVMVVLSVVAAALAIFPPPAPPAPEPLLAASQPPQGLHTTRDAQTQRLEPDPAGGWLLRWGPESSLTTWPASEARVRPGLRMLTEATLAPGQPASLPSNAPSLTIVGPTSATIRFGVGAAAGRIPVTVESAGQYRSGLTDERLHAVFVRSGLLPWRDDRAMPGVARDPVNLLITAPAAGDARIQLARSEGRWGMLAPVSPERADAAAVQSSVEALGRITIVSFRDDGNPADLGLESPRVSLEVRGGRAPDTYSWRLDIGAPASADGNQVYARLSGHRGDPGSPSATTFGPVYAVIGLDALSGVYTNPEAYLAHTSLGTVAADIRRFAIKTPDNARAWRYQRTLDGWQVTGPSATAPRPATAIESASIPDVLELLATTPAASKSLREPAGFVAAAILEVEGASGLASESIVIGRAPTGDAAASGTMLVVQAGSVWRLYPQVPESLESLLPVAP